MRHNDSQYDCFSEKGATSLPNQATIDNYCQQGIEPIIFLDSCVCLHIVKVIDYGRAAKNVNLSRIIALKEYLHKHTGIRVEPFFALIELCTTSGILDQGKLQDFKYRIDFFQQIPFKAFRNFNYDFHKNYFVFRALKGTLHDPGNEIELLQKNTYCSLLKIRSLASKGLGRDNAEKNIVAFLDWMVSELDSIRGVEYKLAMNIFGGNTNYRKMIGLDCKQSDIKKKLWGTCWDIFHAKHTSNSFRLFQLLGRNIQPYFLTSDANLFSIFKNFSLRLIKDGGDDFVSSFILNSDFTIPHLKDDFVAKQNERMMNIFVDRRNQTYSFDEVKVDNMIRSLEIENGIAT